MDINDLKGTFADVNAKMGVALEHLKHELAGVRTGRASVTILDNIHVDAYGSRLPLNQVAGLSIPEPTLIVAPRHEDFPIAWEETFAPILYIFEVDDLDEALRAHNAVPQGLASAIFTDSLRAAERFLSASQGRQVPARSGSRPCDRGSCCRLGRGLHLRGGFGAAAERGTRGSRQ